MPYHPVGMPVIPYIDGSQTCDNVCRVVYNQWTELLDWNTGMDYWTDIFWFVHIFGWFN